MACGTLAVAFGVQSELQLAVNLHLMLWMKMQQFQNGVKILLCLHLLRSGHAAKSYIFDVHTSCLPMGRVGSVGVGTVGVVVVSGIEIVGVWSVGDFGWKQHFAVSVGQILISRGWQYPHHMGNHKHCIHPHCTEKKNARITIGAAENSIICARGLIPNSIGRWVVDTVKQFRGLSIAAIAIKTDIHLRLTSVGQEEVFINPSVSCKKYDNANS